MVHTKLVSFKELICVLFVEITYAISLATSIQMTKTTYVILYYILLNYIEIMLYYII